METVADDEKTMTIRFTEDEAYAIFYLLRDEVPARSPELESVMLKIQRSKCDQDVGLFNTSIH